MLPSSSSCKFLIIIFYVLCIDKKNEAELKNKKTQEVIEEEAPTSTAWKTGIMVVKDAQIAEDTLNIKMEILKRQKKWFLELNLYKVLLF